MNITRKDLVEAIYDELTKKNIEISADEIKDIIELFLTQIIEELKDGQTIEFRNFGVFKTYIRQGRLGHNPKTKVKVKVPPKRIVKFLPGRLMKDELKKYDNLYLQQ